MILALYALFMLLVSVMLFYLVRHYVFSLVALYYRKGQPNYALHGLSFKPMVSVLIPARNEETVLGRLLYRITELTYPKDKLEVIVINDASKDQTGNIAEDFARMHSIIKVIHREPSFAGKGKPSSLNEGLKHSKGQILICFDADYYPPIDIVEKLVGYFVDPEVGLVQGRVTVLNESASLVSRLAAMERIGGYRVDQLARDKLGLIPQYGGTVGAVKRELIEALGGWDTSILADDTDLTFQVCRAGFKVRYANGAECYEEAVSDWRSLWRQRHRWAKGHMQCFFKHFLPVLRSESLSLREKIDGLLLLNVYFLPILAGLSWLLGAVIFFQSPTSWFESMWALLPVFAFSGVGNFGLFFEIGVGLYLDKRARLSWLMPLLLLSFVFNVLICSKAFLDVVISKIARNNEHSWNKTLHNGDEPKCL
ncbi:MAG TPA: glycosyltransferase family 2 protein [Candidatus Bathyarchaeia archaeon]|nr:glycosyltransferase family 2 protein [Candidatus Bathyarchaeia archaeon]